ncbi:16S rRNA (cytosine(1402)-N(4))-methyltransferase RsmH [SAR86 cluster bacterium]|jgi:16S rRNA (cytosine1402-N4)-methyltransferase|nr:16S rRNA (cytosine(1402)-N(4))-methyltransferase RsmH [SAR86 cluster bacterium]
MFSHAPVMINESLDSLMLNKSGAYLDCTFGLGGHSKEILKRLDSRGSLSAIDQDQAALQYANKIQDPRFKFQYSKFSKIGELFVNKKFDGIFFDLGVSSLQLDDASRGFSFQRNGKLDMRMDQTNKISALDWINKAKEQEIADIFYYLGEERKSRLFAKRVVERRKNKLIESTEELAAIAFAGKKYTNSRKHPATNIFRAIRIFINNELEEIKKALIASIDLLQDKGRLVVISFHSMEDRIVKNFLKGKIENKEIENSLKIIGKIIKPSQEEITINARSRSAILRVGEKLNG